MSRIRIAPSWVFLGALALALTACGQKECENAVKMCRIDPGQSKVQPKQTADTSSLKAALTQLLTEVQWPREAPGNATAETSSKADEIEARNRPATQAEAAKQTRSLSRTRLSERRPG